MSIPELPRRRRHRPSDSLKASGMQTEVKQGRRQVPEGLGDWCSPPCRSGLLASSMITTPCGFTGTSPKDLKVKGDLVSFVFTLWEDHQFQ